MVAGVTLAAYAIPVSLAYAGLAGLPPQAGVYGYLLGGLGTRCSGRHGNWRSGRRPRSR
jgi:Sulfate permease and related transporters (MFS superfamily)